MVDGGWSLVEDGWEMVVADGLNGTRKVHHVLFIFTFATAPRTTGVLENDIEK